MSSKPGKFFFKFVYSLLQPLPPAQPINRLRGLVVSIFLKKSGRGLRIYDHVSISNPQNISIGNNVVINPGCFLATSGSDPVDLVIGDDTLLAPRCFVETVNHRIADPETPIRLQGNEAKPIHIGRDCWLAYGVVVLPGCTIGDGAVVGASAVVTRDLEPMSINVGNPARKIGQRGN